MGAAVLVFEYFSRSNDYSSGETDVWIESPTKQGKENSNSLFLNATQ